MVRKVSGFTIPQPSIVVPTLTTRISEIEQAASPKLTVRRRLKKILAWMPFLGSHVKIARPTSWPSRRNLIWPVTVAQNPYAFRICLRVPTL